MRMETVPTDLQSGPNQYVRLARGSTLGIEVSYLETLGGDSDGYRNAAAGPRQGGFEKWLSYDFHIISIPMLDLATDCVFGSPDRLLTQVHRDNIKVFPAGIPVGVRWTGKVNFVNLRIPRKALLDFAAAHDISTVGPLTSTIELKDDIMLGATRSLMDALDHYGEVPDPMLQGYAQFALFHTVHSLCATSTRLPADLRSDAGCRTLTPREKKLILLYIRENLDQKVQLSDLAAVVNRSPFYFARCFKATFGTSPHDWLLRMRVNRAEDLLRNGTLPLTDIAALCGFSSQSHMTTAMRKLRGRTPGDIRRHGDGG